jgi:3-hydroxyisobutyrate dehydrogenase-like beta-hydroxyacid dehydrogenase/alkylhydroperoxidase/carboxymuconolactone decarboxylase family protein YurZ
MIEVKLRPGVIGLGMVGGAVASSLAQNGLTPSVFDVREGVSDALDGVPPQLRSPRDVARESDVVMIAVVTAEQAETALVGEEGLLTGDCTGLVVVLLATVTLDAVQHLARLCEQHDAVLLDAGVTTGGGRAEEAGLVAMVGGPVDDVERALPVLEAFTRSVIHCGPLGTGMAAKLARNAAQYGRWAVIQEAATLAAAGGIAPETFLRVMEEGAGGRDESLKWMQSRRAGFTLTDDQVAQIDTLAHKDLSAAQELAAQLDVEVAMTNLARPRAAAVIRGEVPVRLPDNPFDRGVAVIEKVMGDGVGAQMPRDAGLPTLTTTVEHLFADIWSRPDLTIRDRRLLALGATAMLGRTDLLHNHLAGALRAGELTTAQLRELSLFLHYYAGWGNGTAIDAVAEKLIANGHDRANPPATPDPGGPR